MRRSPKDQLENLNNMILSSLQRKPGRTMSEIAAEINSKAKTSGNEKGFAVGTIRNHVGELEKEGKIGHQKEGFFINQEWKEDQPKAYVLVVTQYPQDKQPGNHYQKILVDQIREGFENGEHEGLNLVSAEIVMGHEYDVIVVIYGTKMEYIGTFVMDYMLNNKLVTKTHTVMVWPSKIEPPQRKGVAHDAEYVP